MFFRALSVVTIGVMSVVGATAEEFSVTGFEKLVIVAPQAHVNIVNTPGAFVRATPQLTLSWSAREDGRTLRITATTNPGATKAAVPKVDVQIPAVMLDVHLVEGQVTAAKWTKPLLIDVQKGKIIAKENRSLLSVQLGQGQIHVQDHQGALNLDVFKADVTIANHQGALEFSGLQSEIGIEKTNGNLRLQLYQGGIQLKQSAGSLQFQAGKASLGVAGFKGRIEGTSEEGPMNIQLLPETEAHLKSGLGRVVLDGKNSGSYLALRAEEGEISGLKNMKASKDRGAQVLRGRLRGEDGGRVEVVTAKGNIFVKE